MVGEGTEHMSQSVARVGRGAGKVAGKCASNVRPALGRVLVVN